MWPNIRPGDSPGGEPSTDWRKLRRRFSTRGQRPSAVLDAPYGSTFCNEPRSSRAVNPEEAITTLTQELNSTWVIVSAILVIFMQAGFLFLEVGFSRGKNAGSGVAKILVNFSIATIAWWACGFALAFGGAATIFGDSGFFVKFGSEINAGSLVEGPFGGASA